MAARVHGNRLLPVLAIIVAGMALFVGYRTLTGEGRVLQGLIDRLPRAPEPDADTPAETIRTLTAQVGKMTRELQAVSEENRQLLRAQESSRDRLRRELLAELDRKIKPQPSQQRDDSRVDDLTQQLQSLHQQVSALDRRFDASLTTEIRVGEQSVAFDTIDWLTEPAELVGAVGSGLLGPESLAAESSLADTEPAAPIPVYTLPTGSSLVGAVGWTALIGRIPVDGRVEDAYPYKVLISADNLAANGHTLPEVAGMVIGGTAIGDFNLRCVRGDIDYISFVFDDGTIHTVDKSSRGGDSLGYLSDDIGHPCVSGRLISNAAAYLTNKIGIGAAKAAALAAAASETTTTVSPDFGTNTRSVTGDVSDYVIAKTLAGGADEIDRWLDARIGSSFDAIFAPAGARVAINLTEQIDIDYSPQGRRIRHVHRRLPSANRDTLD